MLFGPRRSSGAFRISRARTSCSSMCACRTATASTCCDALQRTRVRRAGDHDLGTRHHCRRGGSDARRGFRFSRKAAEPGPGAASLLKNALHAVQSAAKRTSGCARWSGTGPKMIGEQPGLLRAVEQAAMAARSDARVLLIGESGTGKELLAAHIHANSPFAAGPFVKVNCAAIPTELIESELFGHEKGSFTGATRRAPRQVRTGRRRHAVSGRSGRPARRVAGQAAARAAGGRVSPRGRRADDPREGARDLGDQSRPAGDGGAGEVPRGSLLPRSAWCRSACRPCASVRRISGRWPNTSWRSSAAATTSGRRRSEPEVFEVLEDYPWPGNARELRNVIERMAILTPGERHCRRHRFRSNCGWQRESGPRVDCAARRGSRRSGSICCGRWKSRTGTSRAQRGCSAWSGPICTSASVRWDRAGDNSRGSASVLRVMFNQKRADQACGNARSQPFQQHPQHHASMEIHENRHREQRGRATAPQHPTPNRKPIFGHCPTFNQPIPPVSQKNMANIHAEYKVSAQSPAD